MFSCSSHRSVTILTSGSGGSEVTSLQRGKGQQPGQALLHSESPWCCFQTPGTSQVLGDAQLTPEQPQLWFLLVLCRMPGLSVEAEGPLPHLFLGIPAVSMHVSMHFPLLLCISALPLLP